MQRRILWLCSVSLGLFVVLLAAVALGRSVHATGAVPAGSAPRLANPRAGNEVVADPLDKFTYLPLIERSCLSYMFDDFSDPSSGWPSGPPGGNFWYADGRYKIKAQWPTTLVGASPDWMVPDEATVRAQAYSLYDSKFGLVFALTYDEGTLDWREWYTFMIHASDQSYELRQWYDGGDSSDLLATRTSSAILTDPLTYQALEVQRAGNTFDLKVNGVVVGSFTDAESPLLGRGSVGLCISPVGTGMPGLATFDDFEVRASGCITKPLSAAGSPVGSGRFRSR
jgi:hypothetical protein